MSRIPRAVLSYHTWVGKVVVSISSMHIRHTGLKSYIKVQSIAAIFGDSLTLDTILMRALQDGVLKEIIARLHFVRQLIPESILQESRLLDSACQESTNKTAVCQDALFILAYWSKAQVSSCE